LKISSKAVCKLCGTVTHFHKAHERGVDSNARLLTDVCWLCT